MKRANKRGQMFLLAAIIISVVVIGFGTTSNFVRIKPELQDFSQFAYEIKHEAGAVVEYELFSGLSPGDNLDNFIDFLSTDIRDQDPYANFMFIYGNATNISIRNYGSSLAIAAASGCDLNNRVCNVTIPGAGQNFNSTINLGTSNQKINFTYDSTNTLWKSSLSGDSIDVEIRGNNFNFPFGKNIQIRFLNIKEIDDETFVAVE
jgi:hypothetical protein